MTNPYDALTPRAPESEANPYDAIVPLSQRKARMAGLAAPDVAPDQMARALQLADKRGVAPAAIAANLPDIEADERLSELEAAQPHLGDWLTPEHAALARDDIGPLTKLAQAMRPVSSGTERTIGEYFTDLGVQARTMGRSALADLADAPVAAVNWINQSANNDARRLAGLFGQTPSSMIPMREELFGFEQEFRAATEEVNAADRDRNLSFRLSAQERERPDTFTGQVTQYATDPGMVGTDLAGVFGYMSGGGIIPGRTQATLVTQAISQASGTVAQTRQRLIDKGVDEATASAQAAEVFGAALGIGIVAPKLVPGGQSFERLIGGEVADNAASRLGRAALPLVGEPVSEMLEEGSIQLVQNLGAGDPAMRGVGGAVASALVAGTGMAAPASIAGYLADGDAAKTRESFAALGRLASSLSAAGRLEAITLAAAEAKTGKRHPAALEGLAPDETVYVPAEAVRTLFQQGDAVAFVESLTGNAQALDEAGEHGDIAVPMAKWLSVVAQLPNAEEFARHARTDIDGHSRADLEASLDLDFTDTSEAAERATPQAQTSQQRIEQDVMGMLVASDRYRPADAELQAKFMARVFRVMGDRAGIDGWELYSRYKLRINGRGGRQGSSLDPRTEALIQSVRTGTIPEDREVFGPSLLDMLRGYNQDESGREVFGLRDEGGELRGMDLGKQGVGLVNKNGLDLDTAREMLVESGHLPEGATISDLLEAIRADLMGEPVFSAANLDAEREAFRNEALRLSEAFDEAFRDVPRAEVNAMTNQQIFDRLMGASERSVFGRALDAVRSLFQRRNGGLAADSNQGVRYAHAEEALQSRLAQWSAGLHVGGSGPRPVAANAQSIGTVNRNAAGAAEQGDESPAALREQSARLIERAKAEGFFWPDNSPVVAALNALPAGVRGGGAEHVVFIVGEGENRFVIRATDNGYFGPRSDISPAQYLARLDDYSSTFPSLQTRLIGVSESPEIEGHAIIWTAQPFVFGKKFGSQSLLAEAMRAHGWEEDGSPGAPRFIHEATGAVIEDAHTDNVFHDDNGDLYPFDVVVESLPARTLEQPADGGTGPRGSLDIGADRAMSINLFAGANLSTFLHESGHFFLEVMADVAADPGAPQAVKDDWAAILSYLGNDGGEITTEQHETWARSFEAYLMEGQAPAPELVGAFARFRAWLVSVYRALSALNVNLTPEVRSVMDRMIATDEEIEAAQVKQGMTPLELPPESRALVSDAQWTQYVAALQAGTEEARQEVFAKLVAAHKRAAERWYKEETARTREEVEAELDALPIMRAWRILRGDGGTLLPKEQMESAPVGARVDGGDVPGIGRTEFEIREVSLDQLHLPELDAAGELAPEKRGDLPGYIARAKAGEQAPNLRGFVLPDGRIKVVDGHRRALAAKAAGKTTVLVAVNVPAIPRGLKLDRDAIAAMFDPDTGKRMLERLRAMYRKEGGVAPDTAAALLGFTSGDELVRKLAGVPDLLAQIDAETTARMNERHPDPLLDGSLPETAMAAVHNNKRVQAMEAELGLLSTLAQQPRPNARAIRAFALRTIAGKTIRNIQASRYLSAERKAARAATQAAAQGDYAAALQAKREQVLQAALYREALQAQERAEKQVEYVRKFDKPKVRERIGKAGGDLLEMIEGVLAAYSFRPASDKARERAATLRGWYDRMVAQGVQPQVPEAVLAQIEQSRQTHFRDLTVAELTGIVDLVKQLEHQAKGLNEIRLGELTVDLDAAAEELSGGVRGGLKDRGPPPVSETLQKRFPERSKKAWRTAGAWLLRLRTLAQWIDGEGNVAGPFHRLIIRPLDRAQAAYLDAMKDYGQRVVDLFDAYLKGADLTQPVFIASLRQNVTKSDILAVALNMGNASNLQRLMDGRGWGPVHIAEMTSHMTKADAAFVQAVWDALETLWPKIAAQQKRLTGVEPPKIVATPVTINTSEGPVTLRGGYYPLVYDRDSAEWKKFAGADDDSFFDPMGLTSLPPNGHTKARVDAAKIPVKLDLSIIPQHLSSILKDLTHRETLLGINRLVKRAEVVEAMRETLGAEYTDMVQTKLRQVATDQVVQGGRLVSALGKFSRGVRRHVGIMAQGLSVSSGVKQVIGLSNSMEVLSKRHGKRAAAMLAQATTDILKPGMVESILAMSGEMRHRLDTADMDIRLNMQRYLTGQMDGSLKGKLKGMHDGAIAHAYIMIRYIQTYAVDLPLWQAAHEGALRDGLTGDDAVAAADDAVITAQGAGGAKDTALIEGQIPVVEWFTMFYSYASAYLNRQVSVGRDIGKAVEGGAPRLLREMPLLSARVFFLVALPTILDELLSQAFGQSDGAGDDDDDGDEDIADQARFYAKRMWSYMFYGIPGLRDFVGAKYGYRVSPVQSIGDAWSRLLNDIDKGIDPDEDVSARKAVRDAVNVTGYTLGLPLQGPYRHVDYLWRVIEGEEQPESVPEFAAAFLAGKREER